MRDLPGPIRDFILTLTDDTLSPAYLLITDDHGLVDWGGEIEAYGITGLKREIDPSECISFLTGILPLTTKNLFLPNVQVMDEIFANVYLFTRDEGTWVLLLDSTGEVARRRIVQQKLYDSRLEAGQLARENQSLYKVNSVLEDLVRERTIELSQTIRLLQKELREHSDKAASTAQGASASYAENAAGSKKE